jgi:hypothetical protein
MVPLTIGLIALVIVLVLAGAMLSRPELARERGVPVFDASRVGYPPRMHRRRPEDDEDGDR